ncbi:MAG: translation initiation factor IF-2 [Nannocystaceae bacterium]|nr:translation initiation factor IF-2 [bacterium]
MSTDKIRFYELAKEFDAKPKDLHARVRRLGFSLKSYMSTVDAAQAQAIRNALGEAPTSAEQPAKSQPTVRKPAEAPQPKVLRNEDGVIVGTTRRSEPKILGFIKVAPRPKKKKVVVAKAAKAKNAEPGRASRRKERVHRKLQKNRRNESRLRANRRGRRARVSHTKPRKAENRVLEVNGSILIAELAHAMSQSASQVVRAGYRLGIKGLRPSTRVDVQTASTLASEFEWRVEDTSFDEAALLRRTSDATPVPRAPIVTVMGHVDHGKTSLLDAIRDTRVAQREAGGITQHIGAYRVQRDAGELVFLDTPGHQAFNAMRGRGAQVTDIVVLVVAADDGVMPTTVEAIEHAREADVPVVVAVTKCDLDAANPGRAKQQLMEHQLIGEEFGGDTLIVEVSAKAGQGIDALLQTLLLQAELLELRAPTAGRARGVVLESRVRKGHGPTCTVLVQAGTLKVGDVLVAGQRWGKVRRLIDEDGKPVDSAGPSTPVTVVGLDAPPSTGRPAVVVEDDDAAKRIIAHREERRRQAMHGDNVLSIERFLRRRNVSVVPVLIKADVNGSLEAVEEVLEAIEVEGVELDVVATGLGPVTEGDVKTAAAAGATIVGFAVKAGNRALTAARRESVEIETSRVIYELADAVEARMTALLEPVLEENRRGIVEVRALFDIRKVGQVAGGRVVDGELTRDALIRVLRDGEVVHEGELASLRTHKDDVARVGNGRECGFSIRGFNDLREGDRVEAYALEAASGHGS